MPKQRRSRNATESTRQARQDRARGRTTSDSAAAKSRTPTTSASEETDPVADETAGGLAGADKKEIVVETSTKATAIVKAVQKVLAREFAVCPRCHERRYKPEQAGTAVTCINCRVSVILT